MDLIIWTMCWLPYFQPKVLAKCQTKCIYYMFDELRTAFVNERRFSRETDASDNVSKLSKNMIHYSPKDYDVEAVKKTIDYLNDRRFNIMIALKRSKSERIFYNSTEPWSGIKYAEMEMPAKWIELRQTAEPFLEFTLPESNPFIAENFTILTADEDRILKPNILIADHFFELWHRKNKRRPYAEVRINFLKAYVGTSIDRYVGYGF